MKATYQSPQTSCIVFTLDSNVLQTVSGGGPGIVPGGGSGTGE